MEQESERVTHPASRVFVRSRLEMPASDFSKVEPLRTVRRDVCLLFERERMSRSYSGRVRRAASLRPTVGGSFWNPLYTAQLRPHGRIHPK